MATHEDAVLLQRKWNPEELGRYQSAWIAFRDGKVLDASENIDELFERFEDDMRERRGPIIAYVDFEPFQ